MADDAARKFPDQYMLRMPEGMRQQLKALAEANSRSLNAEIIARLSLTLTAPEQLATNFLESEAFKKLTDESLSQVAEANEKIDLLNEKYDTLLRALPLVSEAIKKIKR